jgi:hypothetical protein
MLGAFWFFTYPNTTILHDTLEGASDPEKTGIFVALSATIGLLLFVISEPLYRILEGYLFWPSWIQGKAIKYHIAKKQALEKQEFELEKANTSRLRLGLVLEKLAAYPFRDKDVVATQFGNAIMAFDTYGKSRFNIDSQTLWYELCAACPKYIQDELDNTRSSVDFFVASFYLSLVFGLSNVAIAIVQNSKCLFILFIPSVIISLFCYHMAIQGINSWGRAVQALVNVGRAKLAEALELTMPNTLDEEKKMWGFVTAYVYTARAEYGVKLDQFRKKRIKEASPTEKLEHSYWRHAKYRRRWLQGI